MQRLVRVDGKVRTDATYPAGFMDVIDIEKTDEHFRLIYDSKGRFVTHRITKVPARVSQHHCGVFLAVACSVGCIVHSAAQSLAFAALCCHVQVSIIQVW